MGPAIPRNDAQQQSHPHCACCSQQCSLQNKLQTALLVTANTPLVYAHLIEFCSKPALIHSHHASDPVHAVCTSVALQGRLNEQGCSSLFCGATQLQRAWLMCVSVGVTPGLYEVPELTGVFAVTGKAIQGCPMKQYCCREHAHRPTTVNVH